MTTLIQLRNRAFLRQALAILGRHIAAGERIGRRTLLLKTLECRPPSYFVQYDRAAAVLKFIERRQMPPDNSERREMWLEIHRRVHELTNGPRHLKPHKALSFVLNFTQPSRYFISLRTADRILGRAVRCNTYAVAAGTK